VSARCTGEPVSWLLLERYQLGEVDSPTRERIAGHLEACAACAACLARIEADGAEALPPLAVTPDAGTRPPRGRVVRLFQSRFTVAVGAVAVAAAAVFGVGRGWRSPGEVQSLQGGARVARVTRVKGGDVSFLLVRDDDQRIVEGVGVYRDGDRFKAVVTCPPGLLGTFDLVVFDLGGASFPLEPAKDLACGNEVALPGAFRLRGRETESVCLVWGDDGTIDRGVVGRGEATLGDHALCKHLAAAPSSVPFNVP
jgi:hypothetical protein